MHKVQLDCGKREEKGENESTRHRPNRARIGTKECVYNERWVKKQRLGQK